ncbi:MAG: sigma-70 family RNA polymerase sigma factor [Chitinophagales bacterium]|nr:sigma-70 family RNA polymerase sigma factor [Chitinophagales bacterium]
MKDEGLKHIVAGCRNNDRLSQKALYDRYYGYALSVALTYCSLETEAREVLNDAFLKVFTSIGNYNENLSFTTWLRIIVVRTAINHYHKHLKDIVIHDMTEELNLSVEDDYLSKMAAEDMIILIQKLPPAYRMTLSLFALEGHTHSEIAEMLRISVGASKSNLSKARAKLKQMMTIELIHGN